MEESRRAKKALQKQRNADATGKTPIFDAKLKRPNYVAIILMSGGFLVMGIGTFYHFTGRQ